MFPARPSSDLAGDPSLHLGPPGGILAGYQLLQGGIGSGCAAPPGRAACRSATAPPSVLRGHEIGVDHPIRPTTTTATQASLERVDVFLQAGVFTDEIGCLRGAPDQGVSGVAAHRVGREGFGLVVHPGVLVVERHGFLADVGGLAAHAVELAICGCGRAGGSATAWRGGVAHVHHLAGLVDALAGRGPRRAS